MLRSDYPDINTGRLDVQIIVIIPGTSVGNCVSKMQYLRSREPLLARSISGSI